VVPVAILLALAGVVLSGIVSGVRDGGDDPAGDSGSPLPPGVEPSDGLEVLSVDGYGDLLDAIEEKTGSTEVFDAVLYPTYAMGSLPLDSSTQRDASFTWDGSLETLDETTTSPYTRIDLGAVDPAVVLRLLDRARANVENPTSWYATVRAPVGRDPAVIGAYASNEAGETVYLGATRTGRVTATRP
jgi:hypothetical protein